MASGKVFSLEGKSLKLTTAADIEPYIGTLRSMEDLEAIKLLGNSLGVGACKVLGEILATKKNLRVGWCLLERSIDETFWWTDQFNRPLISPTYSLADYSPRFLRHCHTS
jgi:hypothetical protein